MRPGMTDQLAGIRRILTDIIGPELREGYPSQVLRGVVKNLAMLEGAWPHITGFLEWDNAETATLLRQLQPEVPPSLARQITTALAQDLTDGSATSLEQQNDALRSLLSQAIDHLPAGSASADARRQITSHFMARSEQYPFRMAIATPTGTKR